MTLNERILDFLDGSLPADDEAELLHTLSVSPEKRSLMRGFMEQRALLERDSKALTVPYSAEQRLWSRLDLLMPVEQAASNVAPVLLPVGTQTAGFLARALTASSAAFATLTLLAGIGIGYFAGLQSNSETNSTIAQKSVVQNQNSPSGTIASTGTTLNMQDVNPAAGIPKIQYVVRNSNVNNVFGILPNFPSLYSPKEQTADISTPIEIKQDYNTPAISTVDARPLKPSTLADIGGDGTGVKPLFHQIHADEEAGQTILQRFEFQVDESFGRQFPNSVEANASLPLITNTSLSALFQILPHSTLLWAGGAYGTANVTRKTLFTTTGNQIDPLQDVLQSDTVHSQTSYIAALAELRLPAFASADLTFTAGCGFATLGQMLFGEIGFHYDITSTAGIQTGLRLLRFTYDLSSEKNNAIQSGTSGLVIPNGVADASPSFNTELNVGLFFHF